MFQVIEAVAKVHLVWDSQRVLSDMNRKTVLDQPIRSRQ